MAIGEPLRAEQRSAVTTAAWSAQGQWTAWSVDSEFAEGLRELRLHDEATDQSRVLVESISAFYLYPSPCGRFLSHLSTSPLGLELAVCDLTSGDFHVIERGQPLFWSWSPDSSEIAVHVGDRVVVTDPIGTPIRTLTEEAGPFVAPWWLPGGSVVHAEDNRVVGTGIDGETTTIVDGCSGRFSLDPEAHRLAYITDGTGAYDNGRLVIADLLSGTTTEVGTAPIAGFFWSPDGRRLAAPEMVDDGRLRWSIVDDAGTTKSPSFRPTPDWVMSVLPYFEQYAQSHGHWSSDSGRLLAPAVNDDGNAGAIIHNVETPQETDWIPDLRLAWWA